MNFPRENQFWYEFPKKENRSRHDFFWKKRGLISRWIFQNRINLKMIFFRKRESVARWVFQKMRINMEKNFSKEKPSRDDSFKEERMDLEMNFRKRKFFFFNIKDQSNYVYSNQCKETVENEYFSNLLFKRMLSEVLETEHTLNDQIRSNWSFSRIHIERTFPLNIEDQSGAIFILIKRKENIKKFIDFVH